MTRGAESGWREVKTDRGVYLFYRNRAILVCGKAWNI